MQRETQKVKGRIGVQLQTTALYPRLTVREVLDLFSTFFPGEKRSTDTLIDLVNLHEKEKTLSSASSSAATPPPPSTSASLSKTRGQSARRWEASSGKWKPSK